MSTCLVRAVWVAQIENLNVTLCGSYYHQWVLDIHRIATFWKLYCGYRGRRSQIPVLREYYQYQEVA